MTTSTPLLLTVLPPHCRLGCDCGYPLAHYLAEGWTFAEPAALCLRCTDRAELAYADATATDGPHLAEDHPRLAAALVAGQRPGLVVVVLGAVREAARRVTVETSGTEAA